MNPNIEYKKAVGVRREMLFAFFPIPFFAIITFFIWPLVASIKLIVRNKSFKNSGLAIATGIIGLITVFFLITFIMACCLKPDDSHVNNGRGGYGYQQPQQNPFNNPYSQQRNPYAQQQNPYGQQQPQQNNQNPYGQQRNPNPYAQQPQQNPYGSNNSYGSQNHNPYGSNNNPYGPNNNPYNNNR